MIEAYKSLLPSSSTNLAAKSSGNDKALLLYIIVLCRTVLRARDVLIKYNLKLPSLI